jgi:hypothetical protein
LNDQASVTIANALTKIVDAGGRNRIRCGELHLCGAQTRPATISEAEADPPFVKKTLGLPSAISLGFTFVRSISLTLWPFGDGMISSVMYVFPGGAPPIDR